jgi:hypothetical protein
MNSSIVSCILPLTIFFLFLSSSLYYCQSCQFSVFCTSLSSPTHASEIPNQFQTALSFFLNLLFFKPYLAKFRIEQSSFSPCIPSSDL